MAGVHKTLIAQTVMQLCVCLLLISLIFAPSHAHLCPSPICSCRFNNHSCAHPSSSSRSSPVSFTPPLCVSYLLCDQWMACGQCGVSGPPVGQSAPTGGGENATPRRPKTGGRTVRAWCSSQRTAPMGCACRVSTRLTLCYSLWPANRRNFPTLWPEISLLSFITMCLTLPPCLSLSSFHFTHAQIGSEAKKPLLTCFWTLYGILGYMKSVAQLNVSSCCSY